MNKNWKKIKEESFKNDPELKKEYDQNLPSHVVLEIVKTRKEKNYTRKDLANLTGLPESYITKIETFSVLPTLKNLMKITSVLDLSICLMKTQKANLIITGENFINSASKIFSD